MRLKFYFQIPVLLLFLITTQAYSQGVKLKDGKGLTRHERLSLLGSLGLTSYYGDLCDKFDCMQFRPNFGIGAMYRIVPRISSKTEINYYRLYSKDSYEQRNLNFRSGNLEFYTSLVFDLFPYTKHIRKRKWISPYAFVGIGFTYFNPKGQDTLTKNWIALRPLKTENQSSPYSSISPIIPFGGGIRIKWRRDMEIMIELGYRKTFTDYLDDVRSENYTNLADLSSDEARSLSLKAPQNTYYANDYLKQKRGNPTRKDGYFVGNVKIRYILGTSKTHFKGKHPLLKPHHPGS